MIARSRPNAVAAGILLLSVATLAAESSGTPAEPLPNPLTLEQALALADRDHPDLALAQAGIDRAQAQRLQAESRSGLRSSIDLVPQRAQPSVGFQGSINDSYVRIEASKRLYDFGRTGSETDAADAEIVAREQLYLDARQRRRLEIMRRFFDVILADLRYAADNENMAHKYVNFDKLRERQKLGQVSDVQLMEAENTYRELLNLRTESEKRQSGTRLALAISLNRPGQLPDEIMAPKLAGLDRPIPEYQAIYEAALAANPRIAAMRKKVESARAQVDAERARRRPVLSGELVASDYESERSGRDDWRATLRLNIPLYQGGEDQAAIARAAADLNTQDAELKKAEFELRQTALDLVQELETLKVRRDTAKQRLAYRDLALDRARALYEMEVNTTLGDALANVTLAQWELARAEFQFALTWARVDALTGKLIEPTTEETKKP